MKRVVTIILLSLLLFSCVSCNNTSKPEVSVTDDLHAESTNETTEETKGDTSVQSVVELNLLNYKSYLTYIPETGKNNTGYIIQNYRHTVSGALRYAYYENVIMTFNVEYVENGNKNTIKYEVLLNAAGDAVFTNGTINKKFDGYYSGTLTVTLESVSGRVIIPNIQL